MLNLHEAKQITSKFHSIISANIQSFNQNHEKIKDLVIQLNFPQIIALQEVWHPKLNTVIPNYQSPVQALRSKNRGGGLLVYARDDINFEEYQDIISLHTKSIEKTAILVKNTKRFILVNLYRPPNSNFN